MNMDQDQSISYQPGFGGPDNRNEEITVNQQGQAQAGSMNSQNSVNGVIIDYYNVFSRVEFPVLRKDYYADTIPFGCFCQAMVCILFGFYLCKTHPSDSPFHWINMFLFGAVGQITAGILEFLKGKHRTFSSSIFLIYGTYWLSYFVFKTVFYVLYNQGQNIIGLGWHDKTLAFYFFAWLFVSIAIVISTIRTNYYLMFANLMFTLYLVLEGMGCASSSLHTKRNSSGILLIIAGFVYLIECIKHLVNLTAKREIIPSFKLANPNGIDEY